MAKASDNQFPKLLLTPVDPTIITAAAGTLALLLDSTDGNKLKRKASDGTLTTVEGGGGSSSTKVLSAFKLRTAGNVTLTNTFTTSWAAVDTALDITLAAAAGDVIEVGYNGLWMNENVTGMLDVASIVDDAPVSWWSGGTGTSREGVIGWQGGMGGYVPVGCSVMRAVTASDLSGGNVTLRLMGGTGGGNKSLVAQAAKPLQFWAKNLGH